MMEPAEKVVLTEDEYLDREHKAETKSEFLHGEVIAMAGASPRHNVVAGNVARILGSLLRKRPCLVFPGDQRVHVPQTGLYTYPDVSVVCGRLEFHAQDPSTLLNPLVIVEVLSESTEAYDRGAKFGHYRRIPSLAEYVLVSQAERRVEHYRRVGPDQWLLTEYAGEAAAALPALGIELPLAEIYEKIDLLEETAA